MKLYKVIIASITISIITISCNNNKNNSYSAKEEIFSMNQAQRDVSEIKDEVRKGNIESYKELQTIYLNYSSENFLFWALLMANKYKYPPAYLDAFHVLVNSSVGNIENINMMDNETEKMALYFLEKACDKNVAGAKEIKLSLGL
jgi:hypothetical protein